MTRAPAALVVALLLPGCGGEEGRDAGAAPARTALTVRVTGAGAPIVMELRCGTGPSCRGERLHRLAEALARAPVPGRVCTEVYGGPERARVTGRLRGRRVDVRIARTDGCGIADYDALFSALGRAAPLAP